MLRIIELKGHIMTAFTRPEEQIRILPHLALASSITFKRTIYIVPCFWCDERDLIWRHTNNRAISVVKAGNRVDYSSDVDVVSVGQPGDGPKQRTGEM